VRTPRIAAVPSPSIGYVESGMKVSHFFPFGFPWYVTALPITTAVNARNINRLMSSEYKIYPR
jgi:hypothetical protein